MQECDCCDACFGDGENHQHNGLIECAEGVFLCRDCAFYAAQDG